MIHDPMLAAVADDVHFAVLGRVAGAARELAFVCRSCRPGRGHCSRHVQCDASVLDYEVRVEEGVAGGEFRRNVFRAVGGSVGCEPAFERRRFGLPETCEWIIEHSPAIGGQDFKAEIDIEAREFRLGRESSDGLECIAADPETGAADCQPIAIPVGSAEDVVNVLVLGSERLGDLASGVEADAGVAYMAGLRIEELGTYDGDAGLTQRGNYFVKP